MSGDGPVARDPGVPAGEAAPEPGAGGPRRLRADAVAGGALVILAAAAAVLALAFRVAFAADPLGPRALPLAAAALVAAGGLALVARPGPAWPLPARAAAARVTAAVGGFLLYVPLLPWLGFVPATTLLVAGLGRLFGGPPGKALASGLAVAVLLHVLFTVALGLPLPMGAWAGGR